jgi:hypothetical protein
MVGRAGAIVAAVVALGMLAVAVPASAARSPAVRIAVVGGDREALARDGALTVKVVAARTVLVMLGATGDANGPLPLTVGRTVKTSRRTHRLNTTVRLPLTGDGRRLVDACEAVDIVVTARAGAARASAYSTLPPATDRLGCSPAPNAAPRSVAPSSEAPSQPHAAPGPGASRPEPKGKPTYLVGAASRSINPDSDGTYAGGHVYLGGYGVGSEPLNHRGPATGLLGDGVHVRAIAISDGTHQLAIADAELQGWFVATKDGVPAIVDVRKAVEQRTNGAIKASQVIVQSDHTHGGPDLLGVWGGAPVAYREYVAKQTEDAIIDAIASERPATLSYGTADGRDLLSNQFDYDEANKVVDSDVRVLRAADPRSDKTIATLLNFSAHATVLGPSNTKVTGDWVQEANTMLEQRYGGRAVTMVGTLGRTQPADRGCHQPDLTGDAKSLCTLDDYAGRVVDRAGSALGSAQPLGGDPLVDARSYLIRDPSSNAFLLGILVGGDAAGIPVNRSESPPWLVGNVLGTTSQSARVGDVLISAAPGEMYPQIPLKVRELAIGLRGYMTAGLAGDQLGYLIAPFEAYPEPIWRTFFTPRGDDLTPSPVDNDNYAFNVSHTLGERVTCSLLRGAGEVFGQGATWRNGYDRCAAFPNDDLLPAGSDVPT